MTTNLSRRRFLETSPRRRCARRRIPCSVRGDAQAQGHRTAAPAAAPEINAWVVVKPDDTVVIRIARSEMGQGSLTGLAQLVAEELECNWSKVTTEYPTPGQNLARNRVWGNFSTGGSRGIRDSQEYVRKGGATARMMLVQAAADSWKVPSPNVRGANSVITHTPSGAARTYGSVAAAARRSRRHGRAAQESQRLEGRRQAARRGSIPADKVTGAQIYGMDLKLPEWSMPRSRTVRCSAARSRASITRR
jgi:isoquinoline 1-oxidoreductase beta subunit